LLVVFSQACCTKKTLGIPAMQWISCFTLFHVQLHIVWVAVYVNHSFLLSKHKFFIILMQHSIYILKKATCRKSVVSPQNTLYNVSGFSLPPIKTDRHHITEKLLSIVKNDKN
jgi:cytosine/uracil/thiamine/allantoin permease